MDLVSRTGLTKLNTLAFGSRIWHTDRVDFIMQTVIYMMESGLSTKHMALVHIFTVMEPHLKATGKMIFSMDLELKNGQTKAVTKGII